MCKVHNGEKPTDIVSHCRKLSLFSTMSFLSFLFLLACFFKNRLADV